MKLVIDCFKLVKGAGKSIGIYNLAQSLTIHLGEMALSMEGKQSHKKEYEIIVLGNPKNKDDFAVPGVTFVSLPGNPLDKCYCIYWELFGVMLQARKYKADRILFPRGFRPLSCGIGKRRIKDTIIIHDLIPFFYHTQYPDCFNKLENAYIMNRMLASMKKANRVITISQCSKLDIINHAPKSEDRIAVIYNGVNNVGFEEQVIQGNYMVAMTSSLPHKNPKGVLLAYETYYRQTQDPLDLVVIGIADASAYPQMDQGAKNHVQFYQFIKNFNEMCRLVAGGKAYLFLSYAEGFGFPPLEAMQLGLPVVCSDRSSLPEVVGEAGVLVNPDNLEEVAAALVAVTSDEVLRQQLIQKGYDNIERFSWQSRTQLYWKELFE